MAKKNVVIGTIRGYTYDKIQTFVNSYKQTNPTDDLCLLVNHVPEETIASLKSNGVICQPIKYRGGTLNSWSRFWPFIKPFKPFLPGVITRSLLKAILPLQTVRFLHYKDFLVKNAHLYQNVLLTDVRDVFFQTEIFGDVQHDKVQAFEEFGVIGQELLYNVPWVKALYGDHAIDAFADKKILCSGTILGPVDKMIEFLDDYEKILVTAVNLGVGGSDQGIYNYLIRMNKTDKVDVVKYDVGEVITVSPTEDYTNRLKGGYLYNSDNEIVPVVHQYDRSEIVSKAKDEWLKD